jgi:CRISPR-associated protein Cst2
VTASASSVKPKVSWNLEPALKAERVKALLVALQHLWSSGRQSRFLADISPKFIAAAATTAKVPIFLESVNRKDGDIDLQALQEALRDAQPITVANCFGCRAGLFKSQPEGCQTVGAAFATMAKWVDQHYGV